MKNTTNGEENVAAENPGKGKKGLWFVILLVIIAGIVYWKRDLLAVGAGSGYQAVFLSNNQVYFGKLYKRASQYPVLKDVYYLQVTQALQPRDQNAPAATNINLIKLGGEIHGPTDEMVLNRDHIIFFEDLDENSQVTTAIKQYKEGQN